MFLVWKHAGLQELFSLVLVEWCWPATSFPLSDSVAFFHRCGPDHIVCDWTAQNWPAEASFSYIMYTACSFLDEQSLVQFLHHFQQSMFFLLMCVYFGGLHRCGCGATRREVHHDLCGPVPQGLSWRWGPQRELTSILSHNIPITNMQEHMQLQVMHNAA